MKNRIITIFSVALLVFGNIHYAQAQINRTLETKVVDVLAQMPLEDQEQLDELMNEVLSMGEEGILEFTSRLIPLGQGNDAQARYLLHSLAVYSGGQSTEGETAKLVENTFIKAIKATDESEIKIFLIDRLAFCGNVSSVTFLSELLDDMALFESALSCLITIGTKEASAAILKKMKNQTDNVQLRACIKALGDLRCVPANEALLELSDGVDFETVRFALRAVAGIASEKSHKTLLKAAKTDGFKRGEKEAIVSYVNYGIQLYKDGNTDLSSKVAANLFKYCVNTDQLHYRAAAVYLLASIEGVGSNAKLIKEVGNSDGKYRGAVLDAAADIITENEFESWIKTLSKAADESKVQIISMLGKIDNELIFDQGILPYLENSNEDVKIAAIKSLVYQDKDKSLPLLIETLKTKTTPSENMAIEESLLRICNTGDTKILSSSMQEMDSGGKVVLIHILGAKQSSDQFDSITGFIVEDNETVNDAVYGVLYLISDSDNLDDLLKLLNEVEGDKNIATLQKAIITVIDTSDKDHSAELLNAYKLDDKKDRLLPVLVALENKDAVMIVAEVLNSGTDAEKEKAVQTLANWRNNDAIMYLFDVVKDSENEALRASSFLYYLRQVIKSSYADDQKLLLIKKVVPFAQSIDEKKAVLRASRNLQTFLSLVFVSQYLDAPELMSMASGTAITIALPTPTFKGLSGEIVRDIVSRSISNLQGQDSQYLKIDVKEFLDNMSTEKGYLPIFNGKDLNGWKGLVENPIKRSQMSDKKLAQKQTKADAEMNEDWTVENGHLKFVGEGFKNICSVKKYADFEMLVDWKIGKGGDSGVYLRGTPQVQIWDTALIEVGAQVGSGGLYNNTKNESKPLVVADNPINEWNTFRIKMVENEVTVYLNGQLVVDKVELENYWDRTLSIFSKEAIELQAHGEDVQFRNVYVKELNQEVAAISDEEIAAGFVSLFNGKDIDQWQGNKKDYYADNGVLVVQPERGGHGNLYTAKEYADFVFRFEFQLTPGANNGLGIHAPLEGDAAYVGKELQILDNTAEIYAKLEEYQYHASVYGVIPAKRGFQNPVGEWNTQEVMVKGDEIKITLNGTVILEANMKEASKNGTLDGKDHPGLKRNKGYIAFLGHGSELKFRNIRIKDLSN